MAPLVSHGWILRVNRSTGFKQSQTFAEWRDKIRSQVWKVAQSATQSQSKQSEAERYQADSTRFKLDSIVFKQIQIDQAASTVNISSVPILVVLVLLNILVPSSAYLGPRRFRRTFVGLWGPWGTCQISCSRFCKSLCSSGCSKLAVQLMWHLTLTVNVWTWRSGFKWLYLESASGLRQVGNQFNSKLPLLGAKPRPRSIARNS
jgi:hypothetical protein